MNTGKSVSRLVPFAAKLPKFPHTHKSSKLMPTEITKDESTFSEIMPKFVQNHNGATAQPTTVATIDYSKLPMPRLNDFLSRINLKELTDFILNNGETQLYRRGKAICAEGVVCPVIAIVRSGYFKYSVINSQGDTCITGFSFVNEIVTDYANSLLFGKPSFTMISAGCDAEIIQVNINDARKHIIARHHDFISQASSALLIEAYRRYIDLHSKTPQERYIELCTHCHSEVSLIPLQELASYLSISRRQLHRIRKNIGRFP